MVLPILTQKGKGVAEVSGIVMVLWEDAAFLLDGGPPNVHDAVTVGFLVKDNRFHIQVAAERLTEQGSDESFYRGFTTIPKRSVVKVVNIVEVSDAQV